MISGGVLAMMSVLGQPPRVHKWAGRLTMPRGIASGVPMNLTVEFKGKQPDMV